MKPVLVKVTNSEQAFPPVMRKYPYWDAPPDPLELVLHPLTMRTLG